MPTEQDLSQCRDQRYLVVEDPLDEATLQAVRDEDAARMDTLCAGWAAKGLVPPAPGRGSGTSWTGDGPRGSTGTSDP